MKKQLLIGGAIVATLMLGLATFALAQPGVGGNAGGQGGQQQGMRGPGGMGGPGGMMGGPGMNAGQNLVFNGGSLYVLQGLKLVKYDGATLKELGSVTFAEPAAAAAAAAPAAGNAAGNRGGRNAAGRQQGPRGQAAFLVTDGAAPKVLAVVGDKFYCIDAATMKTVVEQTLPTPTAANDAAGAAGQPPRPLGGPTQLKLGDKTVFAVRGTQLLSIEIATGKVLGQATLELPAGGPGGPGGMGPGGEMGPPPGGPEDGMPQ